MLWGKTLTHIAQECRRLVAELTASNPECDIDVVCWWLGNEICGDYGCLPPLEAMGTAWKPTTLNSVAYVMARIRNGIDVLASLAGMPQVAAVHIHGNPASYIYNLHPKYNVVMTQALNNADEKGLTTVCVDALAQFLVLQDGCHARDTCDNRALFARCLVNTLLLMDREIMAARVRPGPGVDALVHLFRHDDNTFKPNAETQKIGAEMAASTKRIQDEQEARIQARINARSSGQPVAIKHGSGLIEASLRPIGGRSSRGALKSKGTCVVTLQRATWGDAPFILPDNDLLPVEQWRDQPRAVEGSLLCMTCRKAHSSSQRRGFGSTMATSCSLLDWSAATMDIQRRDAVGQEYFLVLIRATQGHRKNIANSLDTDISLAASFDKEEASSTAAREGVPVVCCAKDPLPQNDS